MARTRWAREAAVKELDRLTWLRTAMARATGVGRDEVLGAWGISASTFKRDLAFMRDRMNAPVAYDRETARYRLDPHAQLPGVQYELPNLWLNADELVALLTMLHLLSQLDAEGLLGREVEPLMKRLYRLLGRGNEAATRADLLRRIRVQTVGSRKVQLPHFQAVGAALLQRKRLLIDYHSRGRGLQGEREVSPQRLIHYRDNWYLDAWCHLRKALRSFSVDAIRAVQALDKPAIDVPEAELDEVLGAGYGIFAGREVQWAMLRFSVERSRWVAAETWHPKQRGHYDAEGRWRLDLPYADPRELVMDILRHVPEVEVIAPQELEAEVRRRLVEGLHKIGGLDE